MVNFTPRTSFDVGDLVRCLGYYNAKANPWYLARKTGLSLKKFEEVLIVEKRDNIDGEWIRVLSLETSEVGWFDRWYFEKALYT